MAIRYRNRERRLERTISRIDAARRALAERKTAAAEHELWWRRHGRTIETWRRSLVERKTRQPGHGAANAAHRFGRWTAARWFHPAVLRLRLECWWLALKLRARGGERGPRA